MRRLLHLSPDVAPPCEPGPAAGAGAGSRSAERRSTFSMRRFSANKRTTPRAAPLPAAAPSAPSPQAVSIPALQAAPGPSAGGRFPRDAPTRPGRGAQGKKPRGRAEPAAAQGSRDRLRSLRESPGCRLAALPQPLPALVPTRGPAGRWFLREALEHPPAPPPPFRVRSVPGPRSAAGVRPLPRLKFKFICVF